MIPKEHWPDLYATPDELLAATVRTARRVATAVRDSLAPDGLNLLQANGPGAAQSVFHFHIHVLPRVNGDDLKANWGINPGDMDTIKQAAEAISAKL